MLCLYIIFEINIQENLGDAKKISLDLIRDFHKGSVYQNQLY